MRDIKCIVFGLAVAAFLWMLGMPGAAAQSQRAEIAAVVNDAIITTTDIDMRLRLNTGGQPIPPQERDLARQAVLDELINEAIQQQEADALSISVDDQQVDQAFATIAARNNMTADQFRQQLQGAGVPVEILYDKLKTDIAWSQVVRRKLRPQVAISEGDIDAAFDTIDRDSAATQYRIAEIFMAADPQQERDPAVEARMEQVIGALREGRRFSEVAVRYSEAIGASRGGDMGWMTLDQLDASYRDFAENLEPGQLSRPFRTERGYHLLFMIEKREGRDPMASAPVDSPSPQPAETVVQDVVERVRLQQIFIPVAEDEPAALKNTKMARASALREEISGCEDMRGHFADFSETSLTGDLGVVALADLPEPVAKEVESLQVGQLSRPMVNSRGVFVLMVCEQLRARPATTPPVAANGAGAASPVQEAALNIGARDDEAAREQIANNLGMERLDALQQRYLRDLRAAAYIDRRI